MPNIVTESYSHQEGSGPQRSQSSAAGVHLRSKYTCRVIPACDCVGEIAEKWESLRSKNAALWSPFFSVEFTRAVGAVREDSFVAVIESADEPVGFLPFHRSGSTLYPIGRSVNDAHGIISASHDDVPWKWLLKQLDAASYDFHCLLAQPSDVSEHAFGWHRNFLCDLTLPQEGYATWLENNRRTIKKQHRKTKKLIRDVGPVRLDFASRDEQVLESLMRLKSKQYQKTKIFDIFSVQWIRDLMRYMLSHDGQIQGRLSAYYAGDQLVAAHMGMQQGTLLHYWFPVYDTNYGFASPGTAMFMDLVRQAEANEIQKIDFGYGEIPYKWTLNNVVSESPFGAICTSQSGWYRRRLRNQASRWVRTLPGKEFSKRLLRKVRPEYGQKDYS